MIVLKNIRSRFNRFCLRHRNKGIPNLALFIAIGTFIVTLLYNLNFPQIYSYFCFDYSKILQGQVWRLFTYIFTLSYSSSTITVLSVFTSLLFLYCFVSIGRAVENAIGTLRFNLYFLSGILIMDIFGMVFGGFSVLVLEGNVLFVQQDCSQLFAGNMAFMLYLSLILCYATLYPDSRFLLFYILPIKAWIMALFYFIYLLYQIIAVATSFGCYPQCLFPLVGLANYFLFFGKDAGNLIPDFLKFRVSRRSRKKAAPKQTGSVPFNREPPKKAPAPYNHRCTVCGRTDTSNPELEFRYCSRCNGYFCYCQEHINNHTHIE